MKPSRWTTWMRRCAERDKRTHRRAIRNFTMHFMDWQQNGEPLEVVMSNGDRVPIRPTGRWPGWFHWYYKKAR